MTTPATDDDRFLSTLASTLGLGAATRVEEYHPETARKTNRRRFFRVDVEGRPAFMVKLPTNPADGKPREEVANLRELRGVAAPRALRGWDDGFVMDYVGVADFPDVFRARSPEDRFGLIDRIVDEIATFHASAAAARVEDMADVVADYLGGAGTELLASLAGTKGEIGPTHGDLGPWNIRLDERDRPFLIDWEDYKSRGIPWLDALNFSLTLPLLCFSAKPTTRFDELFVDTFLRDTESSRVVHRALSRYAARRGVPLAVVLGWLPVFCEAMCHRVRSQGRSLDNMYYPTFQRRFSVSAVRWLDGSSS